MGRAGVASRAVVSRRTGLEGGVRKRKQGGFRGP